VAALFSDATEMDVSLREQRARLRLLEELRDTGAGLNRGAQAIIKAAAAGRLYGVLGTLGSLLEAPERYEQAIEAVLGAALQNVVTETWQDAEEGIALLKRSGAGRATFLPLDTLRPPNRPSPPAGAGIIGLAADLVNCPDHARPAVQHALGRVLVVEDLPAARSLVSRMGGLGAVVTLAGDTLRPGGALTGGTGVRESGVLARSRELRELPSRIESAERERRDVEDRLREARQRSEEAAALERSRSAEREAADKEMRAAQGLADDARRRLERAAQEQEWLQATVRKLEAEREALRSAVDRAEEEVRTAEAEASEAARRLRVATEAAGALEREARDAASQLAALRTELAVAGERLRASQAAERRAQGSLDRARSAAATARSAEQECTQRAREALEAAALARSRHDELVRRLRALDDRLTPLRASLHRAGLDLEAARSEASRLATEALGAEEERLAAALELERARDAHASLLARAARETCQAEIPRGLLPPDDVERLIQAGTDRLARIGPVNALAAREHEELQARAEFLERQLEDVQSAQVDLRRLIASLEEQMERRFSDTFREVSERFGAHFRRLFGGGAAELALVTKGDSVGVEIRAQPPGKRLGSLSLLSGGERALTSCALLFALIQAGGAPFCVLDEVDAALDESNVGRFCDLLEDLARETQFIVVTHNRGTIERASTLYGVSMEASGVSKVLSLRLESEAEERASA
jgi:chromosome segregation protein